MDRQSARITRIAAFLTVLSATWSPAQASLSDTLASTSKLEIGIREARSIESKLGQLFIVNVDGFGYSGQLALEPGFAPLIARLQIGGVVPHYGSTDIEKIQRTNRALAGMTRLPLLICCDIVKLKAPRTGRIASFGDGYAGGFIGKYKALGDPEFLQLAELNAFVFSGLGINVALGPTVDSSTGDARTVARARTVISQLRRFGCAPVIKHFPYLPRGANLHRESPDTRLPLPEVRRRISVFGEMKDDSDLLMTTHLMNTLVDRDIATFSPAWNGMLRSETAFDGLLMSDGLLMLKNYKDAPALKGGPSGREMAGLSETAAWAVRALIAGHDMLIVEGSAAQTLSTFEGVFAAACRDSELGRRLRARIGESYEKIIRWKSEHTAALRRQPEVAASSIADVVGIVPAGDEKLSSFHFNKDAIARLSRAMEEVAIQ